MRRPQSLHKSVPILWRVLKYLWPTVRRERPLIAASMAALLASSLLRLVEPWPLKFVFDYVISDKSSAAGSPVPLISNLGSLQLLIPTQCPQ